jgi:predicted TIM-barrel fold metal-dependent hydrolase
MKNSPFGMSGVCDCHTHVFPPQTQIPFLPNRHYTPDIATIEQLQAMHASIGVERVVIVHPSPYGADNTCLLWALNEIGSSARGVAVIDEHTTIDTLKTLHEAGTRGTRINLETHGQSDPTIARDYLFKTIEQIQSFGWHIQMFTNLNVIDRLHDTLMTSPVPIVIDHFGRLKANEPIQQHGFEALLSLVKTGQVYVKLSAPYRVSEAADYADVAPFAKRLIQANPERMLWGTDWPHPFPPKGYVRVKDQIEKFHQADNLAAINRLVSWAGTEEVCKKILVDNPARLYNF